MTPNGQPRWAERSLLHKGGTTATWGSLGLWGDDTEGTSGVFKDGCFIVQTHEAVGIENGYLVIPDGVAPPWSCYVVGSGDQTHLIHVDLAGLET